jgi:hypothetical protein
VESIRHARIKPWNSCVRVRGRLFVPGDRRALAICWPRSHQQLNRSVRPQGPLQENAGENVGGQIFDTDPRQNEKAGVISNEVNVASARLGAPADISVATAQVPWRRTPGQTRDRTLLGQRSRIDLCRSRTCSPYRGYGLLSTCAQSTASSDLATTVNIRYHSGSARVTASSRQWAHPGAVLEDRR